jgi:hypothetical protein
VIRAIESDIEAKLRQKFLKNCDKDTFRSFSSAIGDVPGDPPTRPASPSPVDERRSAQRLGAEMHASGAARSVKLCLMLDATELASHPRTKAKVRRDQPARAPVAAADPGRDEMDGQSRTLTQLQTS